MKFCLSFIFFLIILTSGCGCTNINKETIRQNQNEQLIIVNVLDKILYDDCHIKGSINVPFEQFNEWVVKNLQEKKINYNDHIIVYCSNYMCTASGASAKILTKYGFKNVWAYEAGVAEWHQKGLPVGPLCPCQKAYLKKSIEKNEHNEKDIKIISTQELEEKIKKMQK